MPYPNIMLIWSLNFVGLEFAANPGLNVICSPSILNLYTELMPHSPYPTSKNWESWVNLFSLLVTSSCLIRTGVVFIATLEPFVKIFGWLLLFQQLCQHLCYVNILHSLLIVAAPESVEKSKPSENSPVRLCSLSLVPSSSFVPLAAHRDTNSAINNPPSFL